MSANTQPTLESLGLGVGRLCVSATDSQVIVATYYGGSQAVETHPCSTTLEFRCKAEASFPGDMDLEIGGLQLSVRPSSDFGFAIRVDRNGEPLARGLGLRDRDDPAAIMVAWWTGGTEPYGVVKYSIRDHCTVAGYYISRMSPDHPGEDIAVGDTGSGFSGNFVLNSREVGGRTWGPHQWALSQRGDITDIVWREHERTFCQGIGMPDPQDHSSIIATYIAL